MSRTIRNRTTAYDNISVGNATGAERIKGTLSSEVYGGGTNLAVGTSWHSTDPAENLVAGTVTPLIENIDLSSGGTT